MNNGRRAASSIEYMTLTVFILTALWVSQNYILRGFAGRWKAAGDSFGHERQYDPTMTTECVLINAENNTWVDIDGNPNPRCDG